MTDPDDEAMKKIMAAVSSKLDSSPTLVSQLSTLSTETITEVQQQLLAPTGTDTETGTTTTTTQTTPPPTTTITTPTTTTTTTTPTITTTTTTTPTTTTTTTAPTGGMDQALYDGLRDYVLGQLGTTGLSPDQRLELQSLATREAGKPVTTVQNLLRFSLQSWRTHTTRFATRTARDASASLAVLAGVTQTNIRAGEIGMGASGVGGPSKPILWTSGLGGCIGLAVYGGGQGFLAHFTGDQLKATGAPSALDTTINAIAAALTLTGAQYWICSPSQSTGYTAELRRRLNAQGAAEAASYASDTLALRVTDGTVYNNFPPPGD